MRQYALAATPNEIGGLCAIAPIDGGYKVLDVYITEQEIQPSHFELSDQGQVDLEMSRARAKKKGELAMVWHSHVNMGVSPSGNDDRVLDDKSQHGPTISMIINNKGDSSCKYQAIVKDVNDVATKIVQKVDVYVTHDGVDIEALRKEVKDKCTVYVAPKPIYPNFNGHNQRGNGGAVVVRPSVSTTTRSLPSVPSTTKESEACDDYDLGLPNEYEYVKMCFDELGNSFREVIEGEARFEGKETEHDILEYFMNTYPNLLD